MIARPFCAIPPISRGRRVDQNATHPSCKTIVIPIPASRLAPVFGAAPNMSSDAAVPTSRAFSVPKNARLRRASGSTTFSKMLKIAGRQWRSGTLPADLASPNSVRERRHLSCERHPGSKRACFSRGKQQRGAAPQRWPHLSLSCSTSKYEPDLRKSLTWCAARRHSIDSPFVIGNPTWPSMLRNPSSSSLS